MDMVGVFGGGSSKEMAREIPGVPQQRNAARPAASCLETGCHSPAPGLPYIQLLCA
jgi:hypothetical protein